MKVGLLGADNAAGEQAPEKCAAIQTQGQGRDNVFMHHLRAPITLTNLLFCDF